jgi:hypothetical protein
MSEAAIAFGTCAVKNADQRVRLPDDESRDMTIVWPANALAGLLRLEWARRGPTALAR